MWIAIVVIVLIGAFLLLPIHIIFGNSQGEFRFVVKIAGVKVAKLPKDNKKKNDNFMSKALKKAFGIKDDEQAALNKAGSKDKKQGLAVSVGDILRIVGNTLTEIKGLLRHITVKKLTLNIKCTGEDAADAAINYGKVCAVVYPFLTLVHTTFKVKKRGEKVNLLCDYDGDKDSFLFSVMLSVGVGRVLATATKVIFKEIAERLKNESKK